MRSLGLDAFSSGENRGRSGPKLKRGTGRSGSAPDVGRSWAHPVRPLTRGAQSGCRTRSPGQPSNSWAVCWPRTGRTRWPAYRGCGPRSGRSRRSRASRRRGRDGWKRRARRPAGNRMREMTGDGYRLRLPRVIRGGSAFPSSRRRPRLPALLHEERGKNRETDERALLLCPWSKSIAARSRLEG